MQGFPYFAVQWLGGGYAHVIENERIFQRTFGTDTLAGLLGELPASYGRHEMKTSQGEQQREAIQLRKLLRCVLPKEVEAAETVTL